MGVVDAPQWLLPAFVRSAKAVGAGADEEQLRAAGERLVSMWTSADRCFHNLKHAIDMLARVDELADESHNPDVMRLAVWYHGCIFSSAHEETYRRNGGEDEVASAAYAAQDLQSLGVPDQVTDRICALILNLKRHNLPSDDIDAMALNDADLGALAVGPQQYKRYREAVRVEYAHIPTPDYLRARLMIVSKLLDRDRLFHSPLGERWELPARQNLEAELRRLNDELSQLSHPDAEAGEAGAVDTATGGVPVQGAGSVPVQGAGSVPVQAAGGVPAEGSRPAATSPLAIADDAAGSIPTSAPGAGSSAASATSSASAMSAASTLTPGTGVTRVSVMGGRRGGAVPRVSVLARSSEPKRPDELHDPLSHTTTMESCAADLDRLMASPRTVGAPATAASAPVAPVTGEVPAVDRRPIVEAERAKLAQRAAARAEEAKVAREARTGELQAITDPILGQSADTPEA